MSNSTKYNLLGFLSLAFGVVAMFNPLQATATAEMIASIGFMVAGGFQLFAAFTDKGTKYRWVLAIFGVISILLGVYLFARPVVGTIVFTMIIAGFLFVEGLSKIFLAFKAKETSSFWMILLSGILSIAFGVLIFNNFPASAASVLGILLAVELISNGFGLLAFATVADNVENKLHL